MRRPLLCSALLLLSLLGKSAFALDSAAVYKEAVAADKAADYQKAIELYTQVRDADPRYWGLDRSIGTAQVRLGLLRDATESFDRYLAKKPDDKALAAYNERLKANLGPAPLGLPPSPVAQGAAAKETGVDGVTVFMKDNPRDKKKFRVGLELLTPLLFGLDLGYQHDRVNDFGLGWIGYGNGTGGGFLLHPRWRAHSARFYWDSFFELGGLYGQMKSGYSGSTDYIATSAFGGDIGMGVDLVTEGSWVFGFLLSFNVLNYSTEDHYTSSSGGYWTSYYDYSCPCYVSTYVPYTQTSNVSKYGGVIAYPLLGMNMGLTF